MPRASFIDEAGVYSIICALLGLGPDGGEKIAAGSREAETTDLIKRARQGDLRAFDELVARHERQVWSLAYQISGQQDDAREITQEVFLRVYRHLDRYDPRRPFPSWIYRITVNCTYDYIRKRPSHSPLAELGPASLQQPTTRPETGPDVRLQDKETRQAIVRLLQGLTVKERTVFVLRDVQGLETREIARIMGCSSITVRRHSSNARLKIRVGLEGKFPGLLKGRRKP